VGNTKQDAKLATASNSRTQSIVWMPEESIRLPAISGKPKTPMK
jgi:hypothetical protein